jgi:sensor histidine kinase regulating citrate/malate metabolism
MCTWTLWSHRQGIGLMLIQQILDHHHFDYALESPPTGPTRFTILFR